MKILYKNITKYDENMYKEFLSFHQKIFGLKYSLYTAFIIGLLLILIAIQIHIHNMNIAIIICFIIAGFFLWRYLHPAYEVSKEFNSEKIKNQKLFTFIFYEKTFKIREDDKLETFIVKYTELYKVFETNTFFYLYIDKTHSFLVNKNSFTDGNLEDFQEFIRGKCRLKYKNKQ